MSGIKDGTRKQVARQMTKILCGTVGATVGIDARAQPAKFTADVDASKVSIGALTKEIRGYETSRGLASRGSSMPMLG